MRKAVVYENSTLLRGDLAEAVLALLDSQVTSTGAIIATYAPAARHS